MATGVLLDHRGHAAEGLRWYERILNLPSRPPFAESRALIGAAAMWYTQGELAHARTALTRALQLALDSGDTEMVVHAELVLGHIEHAGWEHRCGARSIHP